MSWVREINEIEGLAAYDDVGRRLLAVTPGANFHQSLDWLRVFWRHYGRDQRLRVLLVGSGEEVTGMVPLVIQREATRVGAVRLLTYPLSEWGSFYGPLGADAHATLCCAMQHIAQTPREWDLLDLRCVDDVRDAGATAAAMRDAGFQTHRQAWARAGLIRFSGGWSDYWASRTSRWRNNVRRCEKNLAAGATVNYTNYRPGGKAVGETDPRWDLYDKCEQVAGNSWQGQSTNGTTLSHESIRPFLRDAHLAAVDAGALDLHLLELDGRPAAFAYNYHLHGWVSGLRIGYDPSVSNGGAGTVLMRRAIAASCGHGDHTYDFGVNDLECKRYWLTDVVERARYGHFPLGSPRGQLLRLKRVLKEWLPSRDDPSAKSGK